MAVSQQGIVTQDIEHKRFQALRDLAQAET
jgi:hypothetical protein